jgi:transketolase
MTSPNLRIAYGTSLVRLGKKDERVVALEADLGKTTQSAMFQAEFPDRYFQMGIAEQNMASTAAGFALSGMIPFIHSSPCLPLEELTIRSATPSAFPTCPSASAGPARDSPTLAMAKPIRVWKTLP